MTFDRDRFFAALAMVQQFPLRSSPSATATCPPASCLLPPALLFETFPPPPASCLLPPASLHLFQTLPSTNQTAWELLDQGIASPVVIAQSQTAGRGQRGRTWQSQAGGLYLSMGIDVTIAAALAPQLTICAAWGIAIALRQIPSQLSGTEAMIPVQIKWLNDLVLEGYKLGGILTETRVQGGTVTQAVIGVGINWCNPVPETGITLRSFLERQPIPLIESLELLAALVLQGLQIGLQRQHQGMGEPVDAAVDDAVDNLLSDYLRLLAHRDRLVPYQNQLHKIMGITPLGELRVQPLFGHNATELVEPHPEIVIKPGTINFGYPI
jgi:BirA family transcriptional regulator, biotin operon repressor / biotin---[acetyl-CoA-carboxylase] ligase